MPTLKQISQSLLTAARQTEEKPFRRYLPNGLQVEIVQLKTGDVVLTLSRNNVQPGDNEWATVLKHWPEPVPDGVVPQRRTEGRTHKLIGRWARPAVLGEAFK